MAVIKQKSKSRKKKNNMKRDGEERQRDRVK